MATGLYLQGPDSWTENPNLALDFKFIDRALRFAKTWGLKTVELAFVFESAEEVTVVPLERAAAVYACPN
jgi:hypothetical protein